MLRCLEYLKMLAPGLTKKTIIAVDGDIKGNDGIETKGNEFDQQDGKTPDGRRFMIGRCYTHILKNLFKFMDSKIPKVKCTCSSKSSKNHRLTGNLPRCLVSFISAILVKCVEMYVPNADVRGEQNLRHSKLDESRRTLACGWFKAELFTSYFHMRGVHSNCRHGPLKDPDGEKTFCCPDQVSALLKYLEGVAGKAGELLTPAGRVHIQYLESNHALFSLIRKKGDKTIGDVGSFLGECFGLLKVLELQIAYSDPSEAFCFLTEFETAFKFHFGFDLKVHDHAMEDVDQRVKLKKSRMCPVFKAKVAARKAKKREKKQKQGKRSGSYISGGCEADESASQRPRSA